MVSNIEEINLKNTITAAVIKYLENKVSKEHQNFDHIDDMVDDLFDEYFTMFLDEFNSEMKTRHY
ncbi:hypothetical protein LCGC14_0195120 [marine sediment metagenome]|uniref:Uncharacterized protein n=1 Tax=marine sediment metagenome TaxID=412755 RepID=A0A0F9UPV9_9ZZZZ